MASQAVVSASRSACDRQSALHIAARIPWKGGKKRSSITSAVVALNLPTGMGGWVSVIGECHAWVSFAPLAHHLRSTMCSQCDWESSIA